MAREPPQREVAFRRGQVGEVRVAESLARRTGDSAVELLRDRRMPSGRGNIDLLAVAPTGVYVIDAKAWTGKVKISRPLFGQEKLLINGRNQTKLVVGLERQVAAVNEALAAAGVFVPVQGVLCFTEADLPFLRTQTMRSHLLMYGRALAKRVRAEGPLSAETIAAVTQRLATAFPPA
jgi:hypothetical protein